MRNRKVSKVPLTMAKTGELHSIKRVGGKTEVRHFLENLGFVVGSDIVVVSETRGNLIVNIKESRVAISREMAVKIMV
jgi:ferrous iron transport protein A